MTQPEMTNIPIKRIVFWEPNASPHKLKFIESVARAKRGISDVSLIAWRPLSDSRISLGWSSSPEVGNISISTNPSDSEISKICDFEPNATLHVFSGIRNVASNVTALRILKKTDANIAIMAEPRSREGISGIIRYAQSWLTERWLRQKAKIIFSIGANGPAWFQSTGYPEERVFPFAYFIPPPNVPTEVFELGTANNNNQECSIQIGYLGRLEREKGVDHLVRSCSLLKRGYSLTLAGKGSQQRMLQSLADRSGVRAQFPGPIPMKDVGRFLRSLDVLVLPSVSDNDGWGVVVSEALMSGIPVIVTTKAGSSLAITHPNLGRIVPPRDPTAIANAIESLAKDHQLGFSLPRLQWARQNLSDSAGASYFLSILTWYENNHNAPRPRMLNPFLPH